MIFGLQRERAGDRDALALSAREFVRIAVAPSPATARRAEAATRRAPPLRGSLGDAVHVQRLRDREADGQPRIERSVRVLEDHLDFAAQRPHLVGGKLARCRARRTRCCRCRCRPGAAASARWWTCRTPTRRPAPASRRRATSKLTCSTACTVRRTRPKIPARIGKRVLRSRTRSSGTDAGERHAASPRRPRRGRASSTPGAASRGSGKRAGASLPCIEPSLRHGRQQRLRVGMPGRMKDLQRPRLPRPSRRDT